MILSPQHDAMGRAIRDYYFGGRAERLRVLSSMFDEDEMPVPHLFRQPTEMNVLERMALLLAHGRVLDVGAGAGCHSLPLQARGLQVRAIDVSPLSVETMRARGVKDVQLADFFDDDLGTGYDTILMLMNGIGICGGLDELPTFFARIDQLLAEGGCVFTDSCDLRYILGDDEGNLDLDDFEGYYGEVDYRMQYADTLGEPFNWLYIDFDTLARAAQAAGFRAELLREGESNDYLAKLVRG